MGIVERIRQIQAEQAQKTAKIESSNRISAQNSERELLLAEELARQEKESKKGVRKSVLENSKVIELLQTIDHDILEGNVNLHSLEVNYEEKHQVIFEWGESEYNLFLIFVSVNPETKNLTIEGESSNILTPEDWSDFGKVQEAVASAYTTPYRNFGHHMESDGPELTAPN